MQIVMLNYMNKRQVESFVKHRKSRYMKVLLCFAGLLCITTGIIISTICLTIESNDKYIGIVFWGAIALWGLISAFLVKRHAKREYEKLSKKQILYACVENLWLDKEITFEDMAGNRTQKVFDSKKYSKFLGKKNVYVLCIPGDGIWSVEETLNIDI